MSIRFPALILALALFAATTAPLSAAEKAAPSNSTPSPVEAFAPNSALAFNVSRSTEQIRIDGRVDDPIWQTATRIGNFTEVEPGDNIAPKVRTEAMFAYDAENLYVAFVCYDTDAGAIRASIVDRDRMFRDDFVGIMIDTFRDKQNGYEFFVNPHGIQGDLRNNNGNEDDSYDTVWHSGGQITNEGWTAEMAIPFRSIRFPDAATQSWGIHVLRIRPRDSREQISWAPISRDERCLFCQAGEMTGLDGISTGKNVEILPYALASQTGSLGGNSDPALSWKNDPGKGDAGVGLKYGITSNYTLDFAYNPDFSQIESDASQISANQTFALFFPERRPFFLEGADMFSTRISAVYTRSINDPLTAAKITGKSGPNTVAAITGFDEHSAYIVPFEERSQFARGGRSVSNIVRFKRDIMKESFVGALVTDRHSLENDGFNSTLSTDAALRLSDKYRLELQVLGSHTREPDDSTMSEDFDDIRFHGGGEHTSLFDGEAFNGHAIVGRFSRNARHYNLQASYEDYSPTVRVENGFVGANNYRMLWLWNDYMFQLDKHPFLERIEPQLTGGIKHNYDGLFKDGWIEPSVWIRFKKQTSFWTSYIWSEERFSGALVDGIQRWQGEVNSDYSSMLSGGFFWRMGHSVVRDSDAPRLGKERTLDVWATLRPTSQLRGDLSFTRFDLRELEGDAGIFSTYITRANLSYQFTRRLFLRVIGEYVDSDRLVTVDPLLSYKINPFTVFFLGSSHTMMDIQDDPDTQQVEGTGINGGYRQTDRVLFVKFQYLFRG